MKPLITTILIGVLAGVGAGQAPPAKPVSEADLVQEFMGLTEPVTRTPAALRAEYLRAVKYLVDRMTSSRSSTNYRIQARQELETVALRAGRPGAEAERTAICDALLALLNDSSQGATRGVYLTMLEYVGKGESVAAIAKILEGPDEALREKARRALQCNDSPEAAEALRKAMFRAVGSKWRVALINAVGYRRDAGSIDWLGKALKDTDDAVALAAAAALGKIGGEKAIEALDDVRLLAMPPLRAEIANALFACADLAAEAGDKDTATTIYRKAYENPTELKQNRIAALRSMAAVDPTKALGVILKLLAGTDAAVFPVAVELARDIPGKAATKAIAELVPQAISAEKRAALIEVLGARGDPSAREVVLDAMRGRKWQREAREAVRLAVIKALAGVGNEQDVVLLAGIAGQAVKGKEEEQKWARFSLRQLRGAKVKDTLLTALGEADVGVRREVIGALGARGVTEAVPRLLEMSGESDATVRRAALEALGQLADERSLGAIVQWVVGAKESYEALAGERALANVCARARDKAAAAKALATGVASSNPRVRRSLMRVCGQLGGADALAVLAAGAQDSDENVREAAIDAMSHSRDIRASEKLLALAKSAPKPEHRTQALRGYIYSMRYRDQAPEKKLWLYLQVLDLAQRPEEKKLALDGLGDIKTLGALKFAMEQTLSPEVKDRAAYAACRVARHIYETNPKDVVDAMRRVLQITEDENVVKEAKRILELAEEALKKAAAPK